MKYTRKFYILNLMNIKLTKICSGAKDLLKYFRQGLSSKQMLKLEYKGLKNGSIAPFDLKFYEQMSHTYINSIPVSMTIKYLRPISGPGKCYDRSLYMFLCFDDAILVRGDLKFLEMKYCKEKSGHGWIEKDGYVYDPSMLYKYPVDLYYKIFGVNTVHKCSHAEYVADLSNKKFYDKVRHTTLQDYQPNGKYRFDLLTSIPLVKGIAEASGNIEFQQELEQYLNNIHYNEKQIDDQLQSKFLTKLVDQITRTADETGRQVI